jgi:XTP/dITP diphosphohydrolase
MCPAHIHLVGLSELGLTDEIPETGATIEENSAIKARFIFSRFQKSCFADDSGLEVVSLNREPGVYSARYAGEPKNDEANLNLLLRNLKDIQERSAIFKTVITYIDIQGTESQFTGLINGTIIASPRGTMGFGYDPIFQPDGHSLTFAEMPAELKNTISHRARAFSKFTTFLKQT